MKSSQGHIEGLNEPLNKRVYEDSLEKEVVWVSIGHQRMITGQKRDIGYHLALHVLRGKNGGSKSILCNIGLSSNISSNTYYLLPYFLSYNLHKKILTFVSTSIFWWSWL